MLSKRLRVVLFGCFMVASAAAIGAATTAPAVNVSGAVRQPGAYLPAALNLSSVLRAAGGLSDTAYPIGAILWRPVAPVAGQAQGGHCLPRPDRAALAVLKYSIEPAIYERLAREVLEGRLTRVPVNLIPRASDPLYSVETTLQAGDQLHVPMRMKWVFVDGAVRDPGLRSFESELRADDYIKQSGGLLSFAGNASLIYPDGRVLPLKLSAWEYQPVAVPPGSLIRVDPQDFETRCGSVP